MPRGVSREPAILDVGLRHARRSAETPDAHADQTAGGHALLQAVMKTLARSERGDDRQLAVEPVHYVEDETDAEIERDEGKTVSGGDSPP